jgi:predicted dehydrogenase
MAELGKVAIVGCGRQAAKHIGGLRSDPRPPAIIVHDSLAERAAALATAEGVEAAPSLASILGDPGIGAVIVATPTPEHYPTVRAALAAGKHVFCEKPLCETREEAQELRAAAAAAGRVLEVGYVYRHVPAFRALRKALEDPAPPLGQPVSAFLRIGGRGSHSLWKHRRESGGGAINEMLVHMLDLAQWLFGRLTRVQWHETLLLRPVRRIGGRDVAVDAEDFVLLGCEAERCGHVVLQADLLTPAFRQYVEVQGTNGSFMGSIQPELPSVFDLTGAAGGMPAGRTEVGNDGGELFHTQMRAFLARLREGGHARNGAGAGGADADDALHLLEVLGTRPCR